MSQLALPLKLDDHAVFESFYPSGNEALLGALDDLQKGRPRTRLLFVGCERYG